MEAQIEQENSSTQQIKTENVEATITPSTSAAAKNAEEETEKKDTESAPQAIIDGSKLIFLLGRNEKFQYDSPCRILLSSPRLKLEHMNIWTTQVTCQENSNLIVMDSGSCGQRFFPIPLEKYGVLYTKDGTVHAVLGGDIRRSKIYSRHLPFRTCNKFEATYTDEPSTILSKEQPTVQRQRQKVRSGSPIVYLRCDDSTFRLRLKDSRYELQNGGQIIAWTLGTQFEYKPFFCFRFVSAIFGEGTVWINSSRRGSK